MDRLQDHLTRHVFEQSAPSRFGRGIVSDWACGSVLDRVAGRLCRVSLAWAEALYAASLVVGWNALFLIVAALILFGGTLAGRVRRVIS